MPNVENPVSISFVLPFAARGKGSIRNARGHHYTDAKTRAYMADVALCAAPAFAACAYVKEHGVIKCPVSLSIVATFKRPKRLRMIYKRTGDPKYPTGALVYPHKPDSDNITKAIKDSLARWLPDDAVVWRESCRKQWGEMWLIDNWEPEPSSVEVALTLWPGSALQLVERPEPVRHRPYTVTGQILEHYPPPISCLDDVPSITPMLDDLDPEGVPRG